MGVEDNLRGKEPRLYSPIQVVFLLRLARMLRVRQEYIHLLSKDDWRMKLLNKGICSTYWDCIEEGLTEDAKCLFERDPFTKKP